MFIAIIAYSVGMILGGLLVIGLQKWTKFHEPITEGFTLRIVRPAVNDSQVIGLDSILVREMVEARGTGDGVLRFPLARVGPENCSDNLDVIISLYSLYGI